MKLTNNFGRAFNGLGALGLLIALAVPSLIPAFASADQLTSRSIALSTSAADASGVTYKITFTPSKAAEQSLVVDFCQDSPIIGLACANDSTGFPGFDASGATMVTTGYTLTASATTLKIAKDSSSDPTGTPVVLEVANIHNPTTIGSFYGRITTYGDTSFGGYSSPTSLGTVVDQGGIALSATDSLAVSAAVRETMVFCVSGAVIPASCGTTTTPSLQLGHGTGSAIAIDATATDTKDSYAQISTNALGGAVVNMKNGNDCGGLKRFGATGCDIAPANGGDAIAPGTAKFGVKVAADTTQDTAIGSSSIGTLNIVSDYGGSNYGMNWSGNNTGVSSTYGDAIFSSDGPVSDKNVTMTFGASASSTTPAGLYTATLSLVATGTY